jgi:hypothetical protein
MRHRFHEYIVGTALPQMAKWLVENAGTVEGQAASLAFFYDEEKDEFVGKSLARLQPLRI